ncbi:MAG: hypothetical protein LBE31_00160 [Deltaproteobacteria bacterium]|nr:hypothetical protein [Deltaproteobacteria bacterium]
MEYKIRQKSLVEELNALGYETTVKAFRNFLVRVRAWREKKGRPNATVTAQPVKQPAVRPAPPLPPGSLRFNYQGTPDDDELSKLK